MYNFIVYIYSIFMKYKTFYEFYINELSTEISYFEFSIALISLNFLFLFWFYCIINLYTLKTIIKFIVFRGFIYIIISLFFFNISFCEDDGKGIYTIIKPICIGVTGLVVVYLTFKLYQMTNNYNNTIKTKILYKEEQNLQIQYNKNLELYDTYINSVENSKNKLNIITELQVEILQNLNILNNLKNVNKANIILVQKYNSYVKENDFPGWSIVKIFEPESAFNLYFQFINSNNDEITKNLNLFSNKNIDLDFDNIILQQKEVNSILLELINMYNKKIDIILDPNINFFNSKIFFTSFLDISVKLKSINEYQTSYLNLIYHYKIMNEIKKPLQYNIGFDSVNYSLYKNDFTNILLDLPFTGVKLFTVNISYIFFYPIFEVFHVVLGTTNPFLFEVFKKSILYFLTLKFLI